MSQYLDLDSWNRHPHYLYFKEFADPYYNMSAEVDVTQLVQYCRQHQLSYFHACLFLSITAANQVEEFRYRMRDEKVWVHDIIHPSCTLLNESKTFSFCNFDYASSFSEFDKRAHSAKKNTTLPGEGTEEVQNRDDVIHYSAIPWLSFTTFTHPKQGGPISSIPRLGMGKYFSSQSRLKMPISLEVNHMFIDGYHIGQFFEILQSLLDEPRQSLD